MPQLEPFHNLDFSATGGPGALAASSAFLTGDRECLCPGSSAGNPSAAR